MTRESTPRSLDEIREKWEQRRALGGELGAMVPLSVIVAEVLADLTSLVPSGEDLLSLSQAAAETGYSLDRIQKLVAKGEIPNAGRKGKPAIRRKDLPPRKPGAGAKPLRVADSESHFPDRRRIVASARTQSPRGA